MSAPIAPLLYQAPALIVAAHPDDEVIGLGGQLDKFSEVSIVHVTDGAPRITPHREAYARTRRAELEEALSVAGISPSQCSQLGAVDQESSFALAVLSRMMVERMSGFSAVFTHPYEGGHPDHDAAAFIVRAAARLLERRGQRPPVVFEFTSYHNGSPDQAAWMRVADFIPYAALSVATIELSPEAATKKRRMFDCYETQRQVLDLFPIGVEKVRRAPRYDFTSPPHGGRLFYEEQDWGITGEIWRRLAGQALHQLGLGPETNDHLLGPEAQDSPLTADR